jgi:hypothetical protein
VWDILTTMWTTPSLFKFISYFILGKFEKLAQLVVLTNVGWFSQVAWKLARFSNWMKTKLRTWPMVHSLVRTAPRTFKVLKNKKRLKIKKGISQYLSD